MTSEEIIKYERISDKIKNFRECYRECELRGDVNGDVNAEVVLQFLISNTHLVDIAIDISRDYKNLK